MDTESPYRTRGASGNDAAGGSSSNASRAGTLDAFEEFFNIYKRPVFTTALAITRDPFLAEGDPPGLLRQGLPSSRSPRRDVSPLRWLQRVCTNLCYWRVSGARATFEPLTALISNLVTDLTSRPEQIVESREIVEVLQRGIDTLPPKQQTAVILYYLHGYSLAEAAEIADCNVGTMKSRLHYALRARPGRAARRTPRGPSRCEVTVMTCRGSAAS